MNTSLPLILLLVALVVIVVTASTAALLAFAPADHVISFSIAVPVPLWLLQLHQFATAPSSPDLRFDAHQEAGGVAETTKPKRVRGGHSNDATWRPGRDDSIAAVLGGKMREIWRQVLKLLEDFAAPSTSYFGRSSSTTSPGFGSYDMWTNEDDTSHKDSDACAKLYRDSKQHQVCAISI